MIKKILATPTSIILADSDNAGNNSMSDNGNNFRARQLVANFRNWKNATVAKISENKRISKLKKDSGVENSTPDQVGPNLIPSVKHNESASPVDAVFFVSVG